MKKQQEGVIDKEKLDEDCKNVGKMAELERQLASNLTISENEKETTTNCDETNLSLVPFTEPDMIIEACDDFFENVQLTVCEQSSASMNKVLETLLQTKEKENEDLKKEVERLNNTLKNMKPIEACYTENLTIEKITSVKVLQNSQNKVDELLGKRSVDIPVILNRLDQQQNTIVCLSSNLEVKEKEYNEISMKCDLLNAENKTLNISILQLQQESYLLKTKCVEAESNIDSLVKQLHSSKMVNSLTEMSTKNFEKKCEEVNFLERKIVELNSQNKKVTQALEQSNEKVKQLEQNVNTLQTNNDVMINNAKQISKEKVQLLGNIEQTKSNYVQQINIAQTEINDLKQLLRDQDRNIHAAERKWEDLKNELLCQTRNYFKNDNALDWKPIFRYFEIYDIQQIIRDEVSPASADLTDFVTGESLQGNYEKESNDDCQIIEVYNPNAQSHLSENHVDADCYSRTEDRNYRNRSTSRIRNISSRNSSTSSSRIRNRSASRTRNRSCSRTRNKSSSRTWEHSTRKRSQSTRGERNWSSSPESHQRYRRRSTSSKRFDRRSTSRKRNLSPFPDDHSNKRRSRSKIRRGDSNINGRSTERNNFSRRRSRSLFHDEVNIIVNERTLEYGVDDRKLDVHFSGPFNQSTSSHLRRYSSRDNDYYNSKPSDLDRSRPLELPPSSSNVPSFPLTLFTKEAENNSLATDSTNNITFSNLLSSNDGNRLCANAHGSGTFPILFKLGNENLSDEISPSNFIQKYTISIQKNVPGFHHGNHPIRELDEQCKIRGWDEPYFRRTVNETDSSTEYLYEVKVDGMWYTPKQWCSNARDAKFLAALHCLQKLGVSVV